MRNIFIQCLYKDIPMVTPIPSKPEMIAQGIHSKLEILLQNIWRFIVVPKEMKTQNTQTKAAITFITTIVCKTILQVHWLLCD